ncbi:MAG TPA: hypothetical protein VLI06_11120 [Solimonas sp.]|nr:hypothetical protein [Solimonas sp.]
MLHLHIAQATINLPRGEPLALTDFLTDTVMHPAGETAAAAASLTPPNYGERWAGQGGLYGGFWPAMHGLPARHLVFSEGEAKLAYGSQGEDEPGATCRIDGASNTRALITSAHDHPAAKWADNYHAEGHSDFHLPSQADLFLASLLAPKLFSQEGWYLSSTQLSRDDAFVQDFEDGGSDWDLKGLEFRVRAVRWIHLNA